MSELDQTEFRYLDPKLVVINREVRQRQDLGDLSDLQASLGKIGMICPILVQGDYNKPELVAGERRLQSALNINLAEIPIRWKQTLTPHQASIIELEENIKREDLPWRNYVKTVGDLHTQFLAANPEWRISDTANEISAHETYIYRTIYVYKDLESDKLKGASGVNNAYGILSAFAERKTESVVAGIISLGSKIFGSKPEVPQILPETPVASSNKIFSVPNFDDAPASDVRGPETPQAPSPIIIAQPKFIMPEKPVINASFPDWIKTYDGPKFNFVHCDFPYGTYKGDDSSGTYLVNEFYDNTPDVYWALTDTLVENLDRIMSYTAHMIFWFDMKFYSATMIKLASAGLMVHTHPLMWHKTNGGVQPGSPSTYPRRTMDTAFLCVRGNRPLTSPGNISYAASMVHNKFHPSQKPEPMLRSFFKMIVDETTSIFDPTCGSGSALRAAEDLGAKISLGTELDPTHAEAANKYILSYRALRAQGK